MREPHPPEVRLPDEAPDDRARRIASRLAYLRLRQLTRRWAHEERAKPVIVRSALIWLVALLSAGLALVWALGLPWLPMLAVAMLVWAARVLMLVRHHLDTAQPPDSGRSG